jgi:hypothetical protein
VATEDSSWPRETEFKGRVSRANRTREVKCFFESFSEGKTKIQKKKLGRDLYGRKAVCDACVELVPGKPKGRVENLDQSLHQSACSNEDADCHHGRENLYGSSRCRTLGYVDAVKFVQGRTGQSC